MKKPDKAESRTTAAGFIPIPFANKDRLFMENKNSPSKNKKTGGILSRKFALFMQITAIIILLGTCAIFVLASRGKIEIDKTHINSAVFCALGLSFLCFVPSKFIIYKESCLFNEDEKNKNSAFSAFVLNLSAGLILVLLSIWKFFH